MNIQKLAYDLSLIYTKVRFQKAVADGSIPVAMDHPQELEDSSFLADTFSSMYLELLNSPSLFQDIQEWGQKLLDSNE